MKTTTFTTGSSKSSTQAANALGDIMEASSGFDDVTEALAEEILDFMAEAFTHLDFDQNEEYADLVVDSIGYVTSALEFGISEKTAFNILDTFDTLMTGTKTTTRNLQAGTDKKTIQSIKVTSEETVKQMTPERCESFSHSISDIGNSLGSSTLSAAAKEQIVRRLMVTFDRLTKGCLHNLEEGGTFELPAEQVYFFVYRQSKDQTKLESDIIYEFDSPCATGYTFEAAATSKKARDGTAATTGARMATSTSTTTESADKSFVSIPGFTKIDADVSKCTSLGVTIIATKNMCPGQGSTANETSTTVTEDYSSVDLTLQSESSYQDSAYAGLEGSLNLADYANLKCTGPNLEVSYYCLQGARADSSGKRVTSQLDVKGFKDNSLINYKIGCTDTTTSNGSDTLTPMFLDQSTGQNSVVGCKADNVTGNQQCAHTTSFGYASTVSSGGKKDYEARLFKNYIFYTMLIIDIYFVIALVYYLVKKSDKRQDNAVVAVNESSEVIHTPNEDKNQKIEVASKMNSEELQKRSSINNSDGDKNSNGDEEELYSSSYWKKFRTGFMLKFRLLTPFTTAHPSLSRLSRAIINCLVLYFIWVFSGILLLLIDKVGGSYGAAIPVCFIIARLSTYSLEILHRSSNNKPIEILSYCTAASLAIVLHVSIFLIAEDMGKEFDNWGLLFLTVLIIDLIVWELISLIFQIYVATKLARSLESFSGKRKSMEKLVTPPLLERFMNN